MEVNKKVKGLTKNIISLCMDITATGMMRSFLTKLMLDGLK